MHEGALNDAKLERVSRIVARIAGVTVWLIPLCWAIAGAVKILHAGEPLVWDVNGWEVKVEDGRTVSRPIMDMLLDLPLLLLAMAIAHQFRQLAQHFAAYGPFAAGAPSRLHRIGMLTIVASFVPRMDVVDETVTVTFSVLSPEILFPGLLLVFASWVLERGRKLQEEQTLTV